MANDALTRNLRDGQLVITDGGSATLTVVLDEGDLSWTETLDTRGIFDRGVHDHTRPGNEVSCDLSYTLKWTQLIGETVTSGSDSTLFYEIINDQHGSTYTSTSGTGEQFTLRHSFTVTAPGAAATTNELVDFNRVFKNSLTMSEGDDYNTISFSGTHFGVKPDISRQ